MFDRRLILAAALVSALGACAGDAAAPKDQDGNPLERLTVVTASGEHEFWVEIADDDQERQRGLMFRQPLADDRGMLFEFPEVAERGFWMKDTPSSLDIVYIGADGRIVSIAKHTTPYSQNTYPSNGPAKGVLETRAGRMDEIGAKPGDQIKHPFFGS